MPRKHGNSAIGHLLVDVERHRLAMWMMAIMLCVLSGCQRDQPEPASVAKTAHQPTEVIWDVYYLQGGKIGYGRTTVETVKVDGESIVQTEAVNHLSIKRFGQTTDQDITMSTRETPDGQLLDFKTVLAFGAAPMVVTGKVEKDQLAITTETQGRRETQQIPWPEGTRGFRAVEDSLARTPIKPGDHRSFKMLVPIVNQVAQVDLKAIGYEVTPVLGVEAKLLRVESFTMLPGDQKMDTTVWVDEQGAVVKTYTAAMQQESFRTTAEVAKAPAGESNKLDLGVDMFVKVEPPLQDPQATKKVVYRVELADGDPAKIFASGTTQTVKSLGPHVAEVTVTSVRPTKSSSAREELRVTPGQEYLGSNSVLQLDDATLKAMAAEAKGDLQSPHETAVALERYVRSAVTEKDFSQGFATAAEVAANRTGDCTEHAVLLAALARICGIPSRVAIGLVYVERAQGFGYHMWTEVFLDGRWVPLDGIMGDGGTSAAYLKLNDSSLDGASAYSSFLSVAQVLGQLKVSVVSAE